jgi:hypothetical protein
MNHDGFGLAPISTFYPAIPDDQPWRFTITTVIHSTKVMEFFKMDLTKQKLSSNLPVQAQHPHVLQRTVAPSPGAFLLTVSG